MVQSLIRSEESFPAVTRLENKMGDELFGRREPIVESFVPPVDVVERKTKFEVTVDLPGLKPAEVALELRAGHLWVSGVRKEEQEGKEEHEKTFHRMERRHGAFRRVIPLPAIVDEEKIEARVQNGVLKVTLPKSDVKLRLFDVSR